MATKSPLEMLEELLCCSVCLDTYTDPKQLCCNHVFCRKCLMKLVIRDQQGHLVIACPNCRQVTPVPANGVADLRPSFQTNQLLEINKHKQVVTEKPEGSSAPHRRVICPEHGEREVELYCDTCEEMICFKCIMKDERHHSHHYEELNKAFERYKGEITASLEPVAEKQLVTIKSALVQLDTCCEEIFNQRLAIEINIHQTIGRLYQVLDVRKTELIGQLHRLTQGKLKSLAAQREQLEMTQAQLKSCLHFMRENLKTSNQDRALMMKSTTIKQVKELTTTFQPDALEPNTEADMIFSAVVDITADVIKSYGRIYEKGSPDPLKCTATGKGMEMAAVGEKSTTLLQTLSFDNQPSKAAINSIACELVSELTGTRVRGSVERRGQSQYQISYQPTLKGRQQLHIKVEGQHIRGGPFPITVKSSVEKLGTLIQTIGEVSRPEGIAVNQKGEVVVAERDGHCVSVFSPSGERLRSFGVQGSGQGQFNSPYGVAVDGKGYILVTDTNNHRIQKFTAEGLFITAVGTEGSGPLQFSEPRGIAYNASNDKLYVVNKTCRIQILNSDLSYVGSFGKAGSGKGQFNSPEHLACDSTGNVYVADCRNYRIQVFTARGKFLRMVGARGDGRGELWGPIGVAIDSSDRIYVSEWSNDRVAVLTAEGQLVTSIGSEESGPGQFDCPSGLAVDSSGVVYVCDYYNDCVQMF